MIAPPPTQIESPAGAGLAFTLVIAASFAVLTAWLLWEGVRRADPLPLLLVFGGIVTCVQEPMLDVLGHVYFPANLPGPSFTAFGRPMPLFIPMAYGFYAGAGSYVVYRLLASGVRRERLLALILAVDFVDVIFELPWTAQDVYAYYSSQPFEVLGFPLWWVPLNGNGPLIGGLLLYLLAPRLRGWRRAGLGLVAPPLGWGISYGAAAWPIFVALNSSVSSPVLWLTGAATLLLAAGITATAVAIATRRAPEPGRQRAAASAGLARPAQAPGEVVPG